MTLCYNAWHQGSIAIEWVGVHQLFEAPDRPRVGEMGASVIRDTFLLIIAQKSLS